MSDLTRMQKCYVWLAGSFPNRVMVQGRGKRSPRLLYALNTPDEIVVFGYNNPMFWLVERGLFRRLQAFNTYTLTQEGEAVFHRLLATGAGIRLNPILKETRVAERRET